MYKKFLRTLSAVLVLCNFSTPGQTGRYTEAFEKEVTGYQACHKLLCSRVVDHGSVLQIHSYQTVEPVEVGHSYGALGRTTHYENRTVGRSSSDKTPPDYRCARCNQTFMQCNSKASVPTVSFINEGDTRVMNIRKGCCFSGRPCEKPDLRGWYDLAAIWERASHTSGWSRFDDWKDRLENLWKAAHDLDNVADKKTYIVTGSEHCCAGCCCTIL